MTRVSTLMMSQTESRMVYDFIGVNDELHYLSHFVRNKKVLPSYDKINRWHVSQLAYFIDQLKSLKDGQKTLFDNSLVLFGSGIKHGDYHSASDMPLVMAGGAGGQVKLGRYVKYPNVPNGNLLTKITEIMGVKSPKIGNSDGSLDGITERANFKPKYVDDGSWKIISQDKGKIEVKGMLKVEVTEENPNLYILQLSNKKSIQIKAKFINIHKTRLDAGTGSVVNIKGDFKLEDGLVIIHQVDSCKRL